MRREVDEAEISAGSSCIIVDWFIVVEESNDINLERKREMIDDGINDWFESRSGWGLIGVSIGGHGNLEDHVEAFVGISVCIDTPIMETAGLESEIIFLCSTLFFKVRRDDTRGGVYA